MLLGFVNLKKCFSSPSHLLKLLVLLSCICFSIYQVGECIEKLIAPPITTYYGFHLNRSMSYPSVTICRRPGFKTKHFPKYGLRKNEGLLYHNVFRFFNFTRYSIKDFLNETTYTFEEVVGLLAYNGCGGELAAVTWKSFDTITQGKCFTFQPGETSDKFSISGGWWFYMLHDMTQRSEDHFGVSEYGTSVYVHHDSDILTSEGEQENNFLEHIYVEAAEDIRMQLKYQSFRRVRSKDNLCIDPEENPEYMLRVVFPVLRSQSDQLYASLALASSRRLVASMLKLYASSPTGYCFFTT
ncbi:uncharacterized protein LOC126737577 isoform X3 [Anthonomus grandis grandis]|uniref:uncharacterized protein LOC126737577 isoform X3 n=1 Tax=Anthonomus grandis grandis TaxID=2921223 RepID=UPI002165FF10|nr:uncharacterized protein LOC126737577 isoform X3 [Anthonomus grandis grandis]